MIKELLLSFALVGAIGVSGGVCSVYDQAPSRTIYPYSDFVSFSYDDEKSTYVSRKPFNYASTQNSGVLIYRNYTEVTIGGGPTFDSANLSFWFDASDLEDEDLMFAFSPYRLGNTDYLSPNLPEISLNMGSSVTPNMVTFKTFPLFEIVPYNNYQQYNKSINNSKNNIL